MPYIRMIGQGPTNAPGMPFMFVPVTIEHQPIIHTDNVPVTREHQPIMHTDNVCIYHKRTTNYTY